MQQIVLLLQLVLALLSASPNNAQVQTLAAQAVQQATVALAQYQTPAQVDSSTVSFNVPTSTDQTQPIVINVTNPPTQPVQNTPIVNDPVLGAVATSTPSCTITAFQSTSTNYEEELTQAQNNYVPGSFLVKNTPNGDVVLEPPSHIMTTIEWTLSGLPSSTIGTLSSIGTYLSVEQSGGKQGIVYGPAQHTGSYQGYSRLTYSDGGAYPNQFKNMFGIYFPGGIHADFGNGVTCDYSMQN